MSYHNSLKNWNFDLSLKMHHDDQARLQSHRKYVRIFFSFYKHYSKFIIITQFDNKTKKNTNIYISCIILQLNGSPQCVHNDRVKYRVLWNGLASVLWNCFHDKYLFLSLIYRRVPKVKLISRWQLYRDVKRMELAIPRQSVNKS